MKTHILVLLVSTLWKSTKSEIIHKIDDSVFEKFDSTQKVFETDQSDKVHKDHNTIILKTNRENKAKGSDVEYDEKNTIVFGDLLTGKYHDSENQDSLMFIRAMPPGEDNRVNFVPPFIVYSTINNDYSCKSLDQVSIEFEKIKSKGIQGVRVYGFSCNSYWTVQPAAKKHKLKVIQGFYITPSGTSSINKAVTELIRWVQSENDGNWDLISGIIVGNEAVTFGWVTADQLLGKIRNVRQLLRKAGYLGPISTAEIPSVFVDNPVLCDGNETIDFVGINAHPYFDPEKSYNQSEEFIYSQIDIVKQACPDKKVIVVETGYPNGGSNNGYQVPTRKNQAIALTQIFNALQGNVIMFTMYDEYWKQPGSFGVEQRFGIFHLLP